MREKQAADKFTNILNRQKTQKEETQNKVRSTLKKIRTSVKDSISESRKSIKKQQKQRATIKNMKQMVARMSDISSGPGAKMRQSNQLNNDKGFIGLNPICPECKKTLKKLEEAEKEVERL